MILYAIFRPSLEEGILLCKLLFLLLDFILSISKNLISVAMVKKHIDWKIIYFIINIEKLKIYIKLFFFIKIFILFILLILRKYKKFIKSEKNKKNK